LGLLGKDFLFWAFKLISVLIGMVLQLSMAAQLGREWTGLQQFPAATQTKLHDLLGKLKQEVQFSFSPLFLSTYAQCWHFSMVMELKRLTAPGGVPEI
jgi:hypothetical protein